MLKLNKLNGNKATLTEICVDLFASSKINVSFESPWKNKTLIWFFNY